MHDNRLFATPSTANVDSVHVLVADDNTMNRKLMSRMLTNIFSDKKILLAIDQAENGQEALDAAKNHLQACQRNYHLIIMDNEMPIMQGVEATKLIRKLEEDAGLANENRAYIASWSATHTEKFDDADIAIDKPVKKENLTFAVNNALSQKMGMDRPPHQPS